MFIRVIFVKRISSKIQNSKPYNLYRLVRIESKETRQSSAENRSLALASPHRLRIEESHPIFF